ncbi:Ndr family protein [Raineyella antarctica]|uniref:Ndr family protein n=1 Tax=Raineyella antarctica TaxID=1577474 RepID=A0A1G6INB8_9ACTN|nr:alpha/beta hydrolase [Raineyella antarctica]SDC07930.1 Ndr family protein [Raineyella antarctica]
MSESMSPLDQPSSARRPEKILVFLHDMSDTPLTWQDQVGALPEGWRPLTPWLRGMKPIDKDDFDLQAAADALSVVPLEYGVDSFAICGMGLGAAVALRCAADSPEMISGLILVNPLVAPPGAVLKMQKAALRMTPRSRLAAQNLDKDHLLAAMDMLGGLDLGDAPEQVTCPTLVVSSQAQPATAAPVADLVQRIRLASSVALPGFPQHQANPQEFNEAVSRFLGLLDG